MSRPPFTLAFLVLGLLPLAASAAIECAPDLQHAGPHGELCWGRSGPHTQPQAPPPPPVDPAMRQAATGLSGAVGSALGGLLVQPLAPLPERAPIKPLEDDNEKPSDGQARSAAQDVINSFSGPLLGDEGVVARSEKLPRPAGQTQVDATVSQLQPLLTHKRKKTLPKEDCESQCACDGNCTPTCEGTCYKWGGKDKNPDGKGIDCSGLVGQTNPCFWYNKCDYTSRDAINAAQEHALLKNPGPGWSNLDDIDNAKDLRAGDVAFFNKPIANADGDGYTIKKDDHVIQITGNPSCSGDVCVIQAIHAPRTGAAVEQATYAVDKNGNVSKLVTDSDGSRWIKTDLTFNGGGTPPPNTGKTRSSERKK